MTTKTRKITLRNDFHNSSAKVLASDAGGGWYRLSPSQVKRARRVLCFKGCQCCNFLGTRGPQDERWEIVELDSSGGDKGASLLFR